ncbi:MAG: phosphodiesterase [Lachnospiraceae bacterium]
MRFMIASDIHGSSYYAEKMIEAYKRERCDRLVILGDILYHGPRNDLPKEYAPKRVIELLNNISSELLCVRGNCEAEVDQMVLDFPVLAEYAVFYVAGRMIFATHGHIYNETSLPKLKEGDILLHGHTHVPVCKELCGGKYIYMNPGSVSIPKENSKNGYMILDDKMAQWKAIDGEILWNYIL